MSHRSVRRPLLLAAAAVLTATVALPARALETPLFERVSLVLEGSVLDLSTQVRLDPTAGGQGTAVGFEDTLGLDRSQVIPSAAFEWQVGRRHRLGLRWQDIRRAATSQALTEIRWGDQVVPIDAAIFLAFDLTQYAVDYTFYPWVGDRWAAGFGLGARLVDVDAELTWQDVRLGSGSDTAAGRGPLPYLAVEARGLLSDHWRLLGAVGWLAVEVGDVDGSQWLGNLTVEYLLGDRLGFGTALRFSNLDVAWSEVDFTGRIDMDIGDLSLFVRMRL